MRKLLSITGAASSCLAGSPRKLRSCRLSKSSDFRSPGSRFLCWAPPTSRRAHRSRRLRWPGLPASPHEVAVLTPRPRIAGQASPAKLTAIGLSAR